MANKKSGVKGKAVPKMKEEVYPMAPGNPYAKKSTQKKTNKKK